MNQKIQIGLICDYIHNPFHTEIISGLSKAAQANGAKLLCFEFSADNYDYKKVIPQTFNYLIERRNLNALVLLPGTLEPYLKSKYFQFFFREHSKLPIVALLSLNLPVPTIRIDNFIGIKRILSHLIVEHGYRRFAYIKGTDAVSDFKQRYEAFISICRDYGIHIDDSNIFEGKFSFDCGRNAVAKILETKPKYFDVIVAANDMIAAGALLELHIQGFSVPEDVAVTGFDDTKSALFADPPITTIKQPFYDMGIKAIDYIFKLLNGESVESCTLIQPELIIRSSCGCTKEQITSNQQDPGEQKRVDEKEKDKNEFFVISYKEQDIITYNNEVIDRIIRYLGNHYSETNLGLKNTANAIGISQKNLTRLLVEKLHISFKKLLNKIRCTEAKRLLEKADLFITDIAFLVGYNSRTHFCRIFTKFEGMSPREYRKRFLK